MSGRIVVVTGAANGIGRAAARRFVADGDTVVGVDLDRSGLDGVRAELGDAFEPIAADVASGLPADDYIATTLATHGRVDVAFLNAGVLGPTLPLHEYPIDAFDRVMAINTRSVWLGVTRCFAAMRAQRAGVITITSSTGGLRGAGGMGAYAASKHALVGIMKTAAIEGGPYGIRVNAIHPGPTDTAVWSSAKDTKAEETSAGRAGLPQLYRVADPDEIAAFVEFLSGDQAAFCTGGSYQVDGGLLAGAPFSV